MRNTFFRNRFWNTLLAVSGVSLFLASSVRADEEAASPYLFGGWSGARAELEAKGVTLESIITTDLISNVSGGLNRTSRVLSNFDLTASFDTEKLGLWNGGFYGIAEFTLITEEDESQGLGVFFQTGHTHGDRNQIANYYGAGLTYTGIFPGRDEDTVSLGMALARNAKGFRSLGEDIPVAEVAYEFTYRLPVTDYFSIQPDFQYIRNPGTDPSVDDAVVLGLRTELSL